MVSSQAVRKQIPRADTDVELRREMKVERESRYPGIEVLDPSQTGSLSAAPDEPTNEDLWGDPVNLIYPLADAGDTAPRKARADNARARFVQFVNMQYSTRSSKAIVLERIVRAQLAAGTEAPSFVPDGEFDSLLPPDLQDELIQRLAKGGAAVTRAVMRAEMRKETSDMSNTESTKSPFDTALNSFKSVIKPAVNSADTAEKPQDPTALLTAALETLGAKTLDRAGVNKAVEMISLAKGLIQVVGEGTPESVGLSMNDQSWNEKYSPVNPAGVANMFDTRARMNPFSTQTMEGAMEEQAAMEMDAPILGDMPGPRVPTINPLPDPVFQVPQPHLVVDSRFAALGVSKQKPVEKLSEYLVNVLRQSTGQNADQ